MHWLKNRGQRKETSGGWNDRSGERDNLVQIVTTAQPRVTSKGGTNHEEERAPTRNDEGSRMICLPNYAYPLYGDPHLHPIIRPCRIRLWS